MDKTVKFKVEFESNGQKVFRDVTVDVNELQEYWEVLTLAIVPVRVADNTKDEQYRPLDAEERKKAYDDCANRSAGFVYKCERVLNEFEEKCYL
jgi:hypothetical protein